MPHNTHQGWVKLQERGKYQLKERFCLNLIRRIFMKNVILFSLATAIISYTSTLNAESKSIETFHNLCKNAQTEASRAKYCELEKKQRRAEEIIKDFDSNKEEAQK